VLSLGGVCALELDFALEVNTHGRVLCVGAIRRYPLFDVISHWDLHPGLRQEKNKKTKIFLEPISGFWKIFLSYTAPILLGGGFEGDLGGSKKGSGGIFAID
jgi:hypothetical protein